MLTRFFGDVLPLLFLLAQPAQPPKDPKGKPSTLGATITLRDMNLAEVEEKFNLKLGYKLAGKATVVAKMSVPLDDTGKVKDFVLKGTVTSEEASLDNLKIKNLSADIGYEGGKLTLTKLVAKVPAESSGEPDGELSGNATAAVEPPGDVTASLTLTKLPLGILFKTLPGGVEIGGAVTGKADFRAPFNTASDPSTWAVGATLTADALTLFGRTIRDTQLKVAVADGKAVLSSLDAVVEGIPVNAKATLGLTGKYEYTATVRTTPKEVSELQKLLPELDSPVPIKGKLAVEATSSGTLSPTTVEASGTVTADELGIGGTTGEKLALKWKLTTDRLQVPEFTAGVFKGKLSGSADIPLTKTAKGDFKLDFKDVDAAAVAATFPKLPVRLTGTVTGGVSGTLPVAKPNEARAITADVALKAPKLTVQGIPATDLNGTLKLAGSALEYKLTGKTLGGSFDVIGQYPEQQPPPDKKDESPVAGSVTIKSVDLDRLTQALRLTGTKLRGVVDLTFRHSADFNNGEGQYRIRYLAVNDARLFPELSGRIRLRNGSLELADASGPLASGTVRARVRASLLTPERNFYRLSLERADLGRLLASFGSRPNLFEGGMTLTVRGKLWPQFTANGTLSMTRGRLAGMTASDLRVPFQFTTNIGGGFKLAIPEINGSLGGGRLSGQLEYSGGGSTRLAGQVKFTNVQIGSVLSDLKQSNYFGTARVTGRIDLSGEGMTSMDDLKGSVIALVEQAGIRDLPVLTAVLPFVSPTALLKPFDNGELRGRLSRGVFTLERLALSSPNAELFAEGTVSLTGRLDLGVIVRTGSVGINDAALRQLGITLPLTFGPLPLALIRDISVFLSNRTVRVTIGGTSSHPRPQLNTAALLTEEAVRFFLRRYLPLAADILPEVSPRLNK